MKSYVKIYGPPVLTAIKTLERIAVDVPEVCIMSKELESMVNEDEDKKLAFFSGSYGNVLGIKQISKERCSKLISKSGEDVGEYDFYFEWFRKPTPDQLNNLILKIDDALIPLGCRYTIITK